MSENKEFSFEEMLEQSFRDEESKYVRNGEKVQATVMVVKDTEIVVSVGSKHTGFVSSEELSEDPSVKPADVVKVGDEITLKVLHVNDADGTMTLSKKKVDAEKNFLVVEEAAGTDKILEGTVVEVVKGGVIVVTDGVRVFIPASQSGVAKGGDMAGQVGKTVNLKITEVNRARRRVIGSIRAVLSEERKANQAKLWEEIEEGKIYYDGEIKENIVVKAIEESSTLIDAYIGKRFRLPLPRIPRVLRMICVDLTIYNLYERLTEMNITEGMKLRYNNAIALLKSIAEGKADIGLDEIGPVDESGFKVSSKLDGGPAIFSLESMRSI